MQSKGDEHGGLEDGEIIESDVSDISDCSLSEIVTIDKELDDDLDINLLREEALKSMYNPKTDNESVEETNEEELEEEQYRLEALKSLLKNIELSEKGISVSPVDKKRKPKRKRKHESKHRRKKTKSAQVPTLSKVESSNSLLREEIKKAEALTSREWYPKIELALIPKTSIDALESDVAPSEKKVVRQVVNATPTTSTRIINLGPANSFVKSRTMKENSNPFPLIKPNNFKKVTKHCIRKFSSTLPVSRFRTQNTKSGKYKLVNKSNYVLNKQFPTPKVNGVSNHQSSKSLYSINRLKHPHVSVDSKEFIIELDEEDCKKDDPIVNQCSTATTASICDSKQSLDKVISAKGTKNGFVSRCDKQESTMKNDCASNTHSSGLILPQHSKEFAKPKVENHSLTTRLSEKSILTYDKKCDQQKLEMENCFLNPKESISVEYNAKKPNLTNQTERIVISECDVVLVSNQMVKNKNVETIITTKCDESKTKSTDLEVKPKARIVDTKVKDKAVLEEAEMHLITISVKLRNANDVRREKLLSDLEELDKTVKQNEIEQEKLNVLSKKLGVLNTLVTKLETKIKLQEAKISTNTCCMNSLFNGVQTRIETCSKFKEVCMTAGRSIIGPLYKPPSQLETVIAEKRKYIDFSKYKPDSK